MIGNCNSGHATPKTTSMGRSLWEVWLLFLGIALTECDSAASFHKETSLLAHDLDAC